MPSLSKHKNDLVFQSPIESPRPEPSDAAAAATDAQDPASPAEVIEEPSVLALPEDRGILEMLMDFLRSEMIYQL